VVTGLFSSTSAGRDYLFTGIGINYHDVHPECSFMLGLSIHSGRYLAAVDVDINQDGKKIKSIHSTGPWFLFICPQETFGGCPAGRWPQAGWHNSESAMICRNRSCFLGPKSYRQQPEEDHHPVKLVK
jgi:hypothetical protein